MATKKAKLPKPTLVVTEDDVDRVIEIAAEDEEISAFAKRFDGSIRRVAVLKYDTTKDRYIHMGSVAADVLTEDLIQQRWKGGSYKLNFHNDEGQLVTVRKGIEIADPIEPAKTPGENVNNSAGAPIDTLSLLQQQLQRAHERELEMIRQGKPAASSLDVNGITAIIGLLQKNQGPSFQEMFNIFSQGMNMGKSDGGNDWAEIAKGFLPVAAAGLTQAIGAKQPAQPAAEPAEEMEPDAMLFEQIVDFVEPAIIANSNPDFMVALVMIRAKNDPEQLEFLKVFLEQPFAQVLQQLAVIEPTLAEEKAATWLQAFYDKLKHEIRLLAGPDTKRGPKGDTANHRNNGGAGEKVPAGSNHS